MYVHVLSYHIHKDTIHIFKADVTLFGLVSVPRNSIINCGSARTIDEQIEKYLLRG